MIVSRAPLRLTLGGGGSDLQPGGMCLTATINKYVVVTVADGFDGGYLLHYSDYEHVETADDIQHPLIRRAIQALDVPPNVQISSIADIPAGTGLGSSGSFTVALLHALSRHVGQPLNDRSLARLACEVDETGWQDQFSAVYGGLRAYTEDSNRLLPVRQDTFNALNANLRLFYTGVRRASADVLPHASTDLFNLRAVADVAEWALVNGDMKAFANTLTAQWRLKFDAHPSEFHLWADSAIDYSGALGGKLVGAGGGGFLLLYAPERAPMDTREVPFSLVGHGVR